MINYLVFEDSMFFTTNIRLGWKWLTMTYYVLLRMIINNGIEKCYITVPVWYSVGWKLIDCQLVDRQLVDRAKKRVDELSVDELAVDEFSSHHDIQKRH